MWVKAWEDVVGHKNVVNYLRRHVEEDNVASVIIFHGNSGIGKSSLAKLLAVDLVTKQLSDDMRAKYTKAVIEEGNSVEAIKLFNMSEIQEKEEEILKVKSEMSLAFSVAGKKVLILDEAHNMSKKAQDSILTELEYLQKGVYVFICTTEVGALRPALLSRCKVPIALHDLTDVEAKRLCRDIISKRRLTFSMSSEMVNVLICNWAQNQPRKIVNLLENFKEGSAVTAQDLEVFINVSTSSSIIELLKYLYGNLTLGMEYVDSLKYDDAFVSMLVEVCKVALGHTSRVIPIKDSQYIQQFMMNKEVKHILQFTAEVAGLSELRRRRVMSAFIRAHVDYQSQVSPVRMVNTQAKDLAVLNENVNLAEVRIQTSDIKRVESLEQMFDMAPIVN